jgi:aminoglycoside phosphotransferase family enzyme/predicted kinase
MSGGNSDGTARRQEGLPSVGVESEGFQAEVAESHSAVVVFMGDHAYKVKKPVDFGFLDFSTVEARELACRREVELNRRLAPDVYLDVGRILDSAGRTCDWMVVMRRMPPSRRLATLVQNGADVRAEVRQIARLIASFHSTASRAPDVGIAGNPAALRKRWTDNLEGAAPFAGDVLDGDDVDEIAVLALRYVDGRTPLLEERVRLGYVVDGHGDLQAEDVFCLQDGPRVLDCLEFDDELRHVDGLDDAAFLAMDLERLGAADLAGDFLSWYREFSGTRVAVSLAHHYIAYRAFVRAKVACLRHAQGDANAASAARHLTGLTLSHLRAGQVRVVLVGGLPGTGKSTVAGTLADRMGAVLLRSDRIRVELPGAAELSADAGYGRGLYGEDQRHRTYREMLARARTLAEHGESVVLDASWSSARERVAARAVADETIASLSELCCVAPREITEQRVAHRVGDPSDATVEVASRMADRFALWPECAVIDTSGSAEDAVEQGGRAVGL